MNLTRLTWIRLISSRYRQELETLKNKLTKAGILSEIRDNLVATKRGMTRFEILVDERDLFKASKICQHSESGAASDNASQSTGGSKTINGFASNEASESVTKTETVPCLSAEPPRKDSGPRQETGGTEPDSEFARATALLEKQVEELLIIQGKSIDRCSCSEEKVKTLEESLTQARADLTTEVSNRAVTEKKLAEVSDSRAFLQKEMQALEVRFKTAELTLAASQARVESQTREFNDQQAKIVNLEKDLSTRDAQLDKISDSLAKAAAGMELEKNLRLAAEQKCRELAAAQKALESELIQQLRQREHFLKERHDEQMRACVGKVNALYSRVRTVLAARDKP